MNVGAGMSAGERVKKEGEKPNCWYEKLMKRDRIEEILKKKRIRE